MSPTQPAISYDDLELESVRETSSVTVEESEIVEFAKRWDPQPFHVDREAAARSPAGGITAAGCHLFSIAMLLANGLKPLDVVAGLEQRLQFPIPVRPGDRLHLRSRCIEKRASRSRPDRGIATFEVEVVNQSGETTLHMRSTLLLRRRCE